MTRVEEIKKAIETLSEEDHTLLLEWLLEREWEKWDRQLEEDVAQGRLRFLLEEAKEEKERGDLIWVWIGTHEEYERMLKSRG